MSDQAVFDYVIVGSGAGGGPLAVNLARARYKVLLLEAGGDPVTGGRDYDYRHEKGDPQGNEQVAAYDYEVPALHPRATRDLTFRWDFFVKHYDEPERQKRDSKYDQDGQGIWYPRAGALGGCTAHNAMITVYPHNSDWDKLAQKLGDPSWASQAMRGYFDRMLAWLGSSTADPLLAVGDRQVLRIVVAAAAETLLAEVPDPLGLIQKKLDRIKQTLDLTDPAVKATFDVVTKGLELAQAARQLTGLDLFSPESRLLEYLRGPLLDLFSLISKYLNPNEMWSQETHDEGLFTIPLAVKGGHRSGTRDLLLDAARDPEAGQFLTIRTHALASRVLFADDNATAVGVEYYNREGLYEADPRAKERGEPDAGDKQAVHVRREVILAGGTYNTPQLLMLSGVGPRAQLETHKIQCLIPLEGVGTNLHDRYEVGVVCEVREPFNLLMNARFEAPRPGHEDEDPAFIEWKTRAEGVYTTNGAILCILRKSDKAQHAGEDPDLFIFGLPGDFKGYFPAYADLVEADHTHFTWAILKAHTNNRAGTVTLASAKPWVRPEINFRYFDEGSPGWQDDLQAVADGVQFVLKMIARTGNVVKTEFVFKPRPGGDRFDINDPASVKKYIQQEAWGHHACGTCKMGPKSADQPVVEGDDDLAVLDKDFRVRGTKNLRVVDASVFPDIPGFFIVAAVYMVSEKASGVIKEDADNALRRNVQARGAGGQ